MMQRIADRRAFNVPENRGSSAMLEFPKHSPVAGLALGESPSTSRRGLNLKVYLISWLVVMGLFVLGFVSTYAAKNFEAGSILGMVLVFGASAMFLAAFGGLLYLLETGVSRS